MQCFTHALEDMPSLNCSQSAIDKQEYNGQIIVFLMLKVNSINAICRHCAPNAS